MSDITELKCYPSAVNALDWSHDGVIAIAAEENVELLFPNFEPQAGFDLEIKLGSKHWTAYPFQAVFYTKKELPIKDPAPVDILSVGEEISSAYVVDAKWSPPGLAKHRRCGLAVLGQNLVLSIWASETQPREPTSWNRVLIVNQELDRYYQKCAQNDESYLSKEPRERRRIRKRARAYAWCPAHETRQPTIGTRLAWDEAVMAVANDDNHISILTINSSPESLNVPTAWNAHTLGHFTVRPESDPPASKPLTFEEAIQEQRYASYIAWSPRIESRNDDNFEHILAYTTNMSVRARLVRFELSGDGTPKISSVSFGDELIYHTTDIPLSASMKWCSELEDKKTMRLVVLSSAGGLYFRISTKDASVVDTATHDLNNRWDQISGITFDTRSSDPTVHFCSLLSTTKSPTASLMLSKNGVFGLATPSWQSEINASQAYFSVTHDLKGHALAKTWGMAASPMGDHIATVHTLHATELAEYVLYNQRRATVSVTRFGGFHSDLSFAAISVSAEAVLTSVKKWFEYNSETEEEAAETKAKILNALMTHFGPLCERSDEDSADTDFYMYLSPQSLIDIFKRYIYFDKDILLNRYTILVSPICSPKEPPDLEKTMIALHLAQEIKKLPDSLSDTGMLSQRILSMADRVIDTVYGECGYAATDVSETGIYRERCAFCAEEIMMENLEWAICPSGHKSPRCGLTFLAIQTPNISKFCGLCNRHYFNDFFVSQEDGGGVELETLGEEEKEPGRLSLAGLLFGACDVCVYCGGKYVG